MNVICNKIVVANYSGVAFAQGKQNALTESAFTHLML